MTKAFVANRPCPICVEKGTLFFLRNAAGRIRVNCDTCGRCWYSPTELDENRRSSTEGVHEGPHRAATREEIIGAGWEGCIDGERLFREPILAIPECPICEGEGILYFMRNGAGEVFVNCDNCAHCWRSPDHLEHEEEPAFTEGPEKGPHACATREEILAAGWQGYIKENKEVLRRSAIRTVWQCPYCKHEGSVYFYRNDAGQVFTMCDNNPHAWRSIPGLGADRRSTMAPNRGPYAPATREQIAAAGWQSYIKEEPAP